MNVRTEMVVNSLKQGKQATYSESGNSMRPRIEHRQPFLLEPVTRADQIVKGDAVLCRVRGGYITHQIKAIRQEAGELRYLIANIKGRENGWVGLRSIFGKVVAVGEVAIERYKKKLEVPS